MNQRRRSAFADWLTFISATLFSVAAHTQPTLTELPLSLPSNIYFRDMQFINQTTGWAVGADQSDSFSTKQRIYNTTDAGQTWVSQLPANENGLLWSVYAIDVDHVYVGGNISYAAFDGRATSDGGNIWLGGSGPPRAGIFNETLLVDVHATSPNKIWAVAGENVLFSTDGVSYSVISSLEGDPWNIEMVSDSTGYVASMNGPRFIVSAPQSAFFRTPDQSGTLNFFM